MFGNLIYYDKNKVEQYMALITKQSVVSKENGQDEPPNKKANYLLECSQFETLLKDRDDYVDFVGGEPDIGIKDVKISSIIKVTGEIYVPESFDMIHLINEYKPQILASIECKDSDERELLNAVLNSSKMKVPIFCELGEMCDYWLGIGKAIQDNLLVDYNELEDLEGREVTIIAKIEARKYYKDLPLKVFDVYKDFLGLNRTLRKQIVKQKNEDFESIEVEEDYLGLELLAIY